MSMYTQLLGFALDQRGQTDIQPAIGDFFAELLRCRRELHPDANSARGRTLDATANELAYDVALVEFAGSLGIEWELRRFDQPLRERRALERALAARGIPLDQRDAP